jgi:hypothetical protein
MSAREGVGDAPREWERLHGCPILKKRTFVNGPDDTRKNEHDRQSSQRQQLVVSWQPLVPILCVLSPRRAESETGGRDDFGARDLSRSL